MHRNRGRSKTNLAWFLSVIVLADGSYSWYLRSNNIVAFRLTFPALVLHAYHLHVHRIRAIRNVNIYVQYIH